MFKRTSLEHSLFIPRSCDTLTSEQSNIVKIAEGGHNLLVTGQAGTGKSHLVRALRRNLQRKGKNVAIVCASDISVAVYLEVGINASTTHAFFGLRTADLPANLVVDRAIANNLVAERVSKADTIIRVFELANKIHEVLSPPCEASHLFGGKQVILVGDFLQLRPVSNFFDLGRFVFESPLFIKAIPHRFELKTPLRQNENEEEFVACLQEIRAGKCGDTSFAFLESLSRALPEEMKESAVHIFSSVCQFSFSICMSSFRCLAICSHVKPMTREMSVTYSVLLIGYFF